MDRKQSFRQPIFPMRRLYVSIAKLRISSSFTRYIFWLLTEDRAARYTFFSRLSRPQKQHTESCVLITPFLSAYNGNTGLKVGLQQIGHNNYVLDPLLFHMNIIKCQIIFYCFSLDLSVPLQLCACFSTHVDDPFRVQWG